MKNISLQELKSIIEETLKEELTNVPEECDSVDQEYF